MAGGVTVRVPGSTSNLGSGFDCVGMAVERRIRVTARASAAGAAPLALERRGTLAAMVLEPADDLIYQGFAAACRAAERAVPTRLALTAESDIPVSRGLGSSAAAVVAGAAAAAALLDLPLGPDALLRICAELEGHPDNVAPAVYGGARLVLRRAGGDLLAPPPLLDVHAALAFVFAVPDFTVETKRARAVLPASVPHATAVEAAARGAALIRGLATADPELLALGLDDLLHVPHRRALVRGYDAVTTAARAAGAHGATLSGSGPTIVAIAPRDRAPAVADAMIAAWRSSDVSAERFIVTRSVGGYDAAPEPGS
jgi:homoserine kinase